MGQILIRKIERRNPFRIGKVPWLARVYRYPFDRWSSWGKQVLFGAPNLFVFALLRRLSPFPILGTFHFQHEQTWKTVSFDARNTQFQALYRADFQSGYEPEVMALLDLLLPSSAIFYDIGSNWGYFSLFVASKPGFRGQIEAFEPFPASYADLLKTVIEAGLESRVRCHPYALSDQEGIATIRIPDRTHSGLAVLGEVRRNGLPKGISVKTLDSMELADPDLIKIDAEGGEGAILSGAKQLISRSKPLIIFESMRQVADPQKTLEPFILLRQLGYHLFEPCWLRECQWGGYLMPPESGAGALAAEVLALVPINGEDRFLRRDQMNIFAFHSSAGERLHTVFEEYSMTAANER